MRISDWSSDVCSSDLHRSPPQQRSASAAGICRFLRRNAPSILSSRKRGGICSFSFSPSHSCRSVKGSGTPQYPPALSSFVALSSPAGTERSEEHTSELQSLMRISYAVFCLKKQKQTKLHLTDADKCTKQNTPLTYI